ncbi:MAG: DUF378 domain-containing protein [Ruminococcaceae bacterium]|nr:DUF378 domain-containing protein [Oscillospiraceae bacterium]
MILRNLAIILLIIGGLNWGLVGALDFNLVAWLCGGNASILSRIIYILVGLAAIVAIFTAFRCEKEKNR